MKPITISNFNMGGISDSLWSGTADSLFKMVGLNPHTEPGILKAEQKLTLDSGAVVTEFCKCSLVSTNGRIYYGSSDSGKIWERTSGGTYTLVHTIVPNAGHARILGMIEFDRYIIIATQSRLHRILATNAEGAAEWAANIQHNWKNFTNADAEFHPMLEQNQNLYIGDGNYLGEWDGTTWTPDALDIPTPLRIKSLGKYGTDVLLGTYIDDNITKTQILRWNTWSVSFTNSDTIDEIGINAFIPTDNFVLVHAGVQGNIYVYNGATLELYKKIAGTYSSTQKATVNPNAIAVLDNQILFGVSNVTGNPCLQGVYRMGRNSRNYPWIFDLAYPITPAIEGTFLTSNIEIGSIITVGSKIFVSWRISSSVGISVLNLDCRLDGAYFETRVMRPYRQSYTNFSEFIMSYYSLPANTALTLFYDKNYSGSYIAPRSDHLIDTDKKVIYLREGVEANTLSLKCVFSCVDNSTPALEQLDVMVK